MSKQDSLILKGIGICAMLALHLFGYPICKICVALFIFVSGYGMASGYSKLIENEAPGIKPTIFFLYKRIKKFYLSFWPIFVVFVSISIFVFKRYPDEAYGANGIERLILDFFCIGNYNYDVQWWFNTQILILYLLFPFLFILTKKLPCITLCVSLLLTKFAIWERYSPLFSNYPFMFQVYQLNMMLFVFIAGIFLALNWNKINNVLRPSLFIPLCLILLAFFTYSHFDTRIPFIHGWRSEAFILFFLALLVSRVPSAIKNKFHLFEFLGKHSSNIYFFHWFILNWWLQDFLNGIGKPVLVFIVSMIICVCISLIIEKCKSLVKYDRLYL